MREQISNASVACGSVQAVAVGGQPRFAVVAKADMRPGDPVTLNYMDISLGGRSSHTQADWILSLRELRRNQTRVRQGAGGRGRGGGHTLSMLRSISPLHTLPHTPYKPRALPSDGRMQGRVVVCATPPRRGSGSPRAGNRGPAAPLIAVALRGRPRGSGEEDSDRKAEVIDGH